jgi:ParB family transcriptional regulator, chromosome partitioning protein
MRWRCIATMSTTRCDLDLHLLDLRFAAARLMEKQAIERLARSIARDGQIVPCIVVGCRDAGEGERFVLVDGYRRVAALRGLGRDRASVEQWSCDLVEAVLGVLARTQSRSFAAIEEALLLRELTQGFGLSQLEVARRCGRDGAWVNRRLQLLSSLPDTVLSAVRAGQLSSWAAIRVLAPLARANGAHAERLLAALAQAPLSTRSLKQWFDHYQRASRAVRERMVAHPQLFVHALNESAEQDAIERLRIGPEGECEVDLLRINGLLHRVRKRLPALCPLSAELQRAFLRAQASFETLCNDIKRYSQHDPDRTSQRGALTESAGPEPARDQPAAQGVA